MNDDGGSSEDFTRTLEREAMEGYAASQLGGMLGVSGGDKTGVLHKVVSPPKGDADIDIYRQTLLLASFTSNELASRVAAAFAECVRLGMSLRPVIDWVICHCAVSKHAQDRNRLEYVIEALTHFDMRANLAARSKFKDNEPQKPSPM